MLTDVRREKVPIHDGALEIAVLDWGGQGPPILLHHANGFCAGVWDTAARALRGHFRVFAMDARGHGDSSKPPPPEAYHWSRFGHDAGAVADALIERHGPLALGIGHSFGGTALTLAALEKPARFARLLLLDPIVMPSDPEVRARAARGNQLAAVARRRRAVWPSRERVRERWARHETFAQWQPRALELYVGEGFADRSDGQVELKCPREVEASIFDQGGSVDVTTALRDLAPPTRILWARGGQFPRSHFEDLAARMPRGEVRDADTGHFVLMEDPELVVRETLAFSAPPEAAASSSR